MNILFDDNTKEALIKNLSSKNKGAVRLAINGFGWGGPNFGIVLDEQKEDDDTVTINNIKFVAEKDISFLFNGVKLIYRKGVFGDTFDIYDPSNSGSCNS